MKLDICLSAEEIEGKGINGKTVVVIDVFRATSTILVAFEQGCRAVIPVLSAKEAGAKEKELLDRGEAVLVAGERKGFKIPGFDLGNSPREFKQKDLRGKTIILHTSNGTRGIRGAAKAKKILIGTLMNCGAVAEYLVREGSDVLFVCSGRLGEFALEDFFAAGAITHYLGKDENHDISDLLLASLGLFRCKKEDILGFLEKGTHGRYLQNIGFRGDVELCCNLNTTQRVPVYLAGEIVLPRDVPY